MPFNLERQPQLRNQVITGSCKPIAPGFKLWPNTHWVNHSASKNGATGVRSDCLKTTMLAKNDTWMEKKDVLVFSRLASLWKRLSPVDAIA